jgi:predicted DNA-binding transcriptional regulator YafY
MDGDSSPTARALLALELLQSSPGITAQRLGERLGVSERAARRYVAVLREAGIPVQSVRGPHGGYRVGRGLRLPPMLFTAPEALGLVMAVLDGHHDASDPTDPVGSALGKLVRSLPESVAAQAEVVRRVTAPAPDRAAVRADAGTTTALVNACAGRHCVRLRYRSEAGTEWSVDVDPWVVVVRHGRWYLLCWSRPADALRAYRVDRVLEVAELAETFDPPADLDPVALLEDHLAVGWEHEAEVVIDAPVDDVAPCVPRGIGRLEPLDGGTTRLVGSTSNPSWYAEQLAAVPAPFRVVGGSEVRDAVRALGERLLGASELPQADAPPSSAASRARSSSSVRPAPRGTSRTSS